MTNDFATHNSNTKNDDFYYDNECDDDDDEIDNASMVEFLSDFDL